MQSNQLLRLISSNINTINYNLQFDNILLINNSLFMINDLGFIIENYNNEISQLQFGYSIMI